MSSNVVLLLQVRMIDEAETTLTSIDNASDRLVQSVLKQAHSSGAANYTSGEQPPLLCRKYTMKEAQTQFSMCQMQH